MNRAIRIVITVIGLGVGAYHLFFACLAILAFRTGEPWTSWAAILLGPGATLAAVIVSIFSARVGGAALLVLAALAFGAFAVGEGAHTDNILPFATGVTLPMAALGAALLAVSRRVKVAAPA